MRAYIEIRAKALEENYDLILSTCKKDIIAVVKSNAYGHGIIEVCRILSKKQVKMFAVASIEEAIIIRKNLIFTPILILGKEDNFRLLHQYKITQTVVSIPHLLELAKSPYPIMIHLLIDTGLNRDGLEINEIDEAIKIIKKSRLILKGIYTHFSSYSAYKKQYEIFKSCLDLLPLKGLMVHAQATSTMLEECEECNALRIGLALYGLDKSLKVEPVLSLSAPIIRIKKVKENEPVGYLESSFSPSPGYLLTCAIGYGDGLTRKEKYLGYVDNYYVPQIGHIFMDHIVFFSKQIPSISYVELISPHLNVIDIASIRDTIPYEIVTHLATRIKRNIV